MTPPKKLHVVFIHLDLGIGGAEQLVLQLATASQDLGHPVDLVTTRCDADHCFAAFSHPDGRLAKDVYIYGNWIPPNVAGVATAFMSTIRMLYLTWQVCRCHAHADIVVVDVLPTSLPFLLALLPSAGTFFYCHFPDKLLLRNQGGTVKQWYRRLLDGMEEATMGVADLLVVNSQFTRQTVQSTFPRLVGNTQDDMQVLYPALDTSNMVQPNEEPKTNQSPIVSLNRFERKKNIQLLIHAYDYLQRTYPDQRLPPLIIAGGYDTQNIENVEYRGELQQLVDQHKVAVTFRMDISDQERATLFQTALCVVYTPDQEHFGIVPLEAMYAGTPVLAVRSGGPMETVVEGQTGFLRPPTPEAFGEALLQFIQDPDKATNMGRAGRPHVEQTFGKQRLETEWKELLEETKRRQQRRQANAGELALWKSTALHVVEAVLILLLLLILTWILRTLGILAPGQSIFGAMRRTLGGDEL